MSESGLLDSDLLTDEKTRFSDAFRTLEDLYSRPCGCFGWLCLDSGFLHLFDGNRACAAAHCRFQGKAAGATALTIHLEESKGGKQRSVAQSQVEPSRPRICMGLETAFGAFEIDA